MVELQKTFRERLVDFTFYCKERQFMLSPQQTQEAFEISKKGFMLDRKLFHYSLKSIYCNRKEHFDRFDEMFDRFWSRYYNELLEPREIKVKPKKKRPQSHRSFFWEPGSTIRTIKRKKRSPNRPKEPTRPFDSG